MQLVTQTPMLSLAPAELGAMVLLAPGTPVRVLRLRRCRVRQRSCAILVANGTRYLCSVGALQGHGETCGAECVRGQIVAEDAAGAGEGPEPGGRAGWSLVS